MSPAFLAVDAAELGTRMIIKDDPVLAEVTGTTIGLGGYVAVGAAVGAGPVGAAVGAGVYVG